MKVCASIFKYKLKKLFSNIFHQNEYLIFNILLVISVQLPLLQKLLSIQLLLFTYSSQFCFISFCFISLSLVLNVFCVLEYLYLQLFNYTCVSFWCWWFIKNLIFKRFFANILERKSKFKFLYQKISCQKLKGIKIISIYTFILLEDRHTCVSVCMVLELHGLPDFLYIFDTEIQERKIKFWFCSKYWLFGINGH